MPVEYREGDLFAQPDVDCIGHGVNVRGVMGAGIAALFKRKYPEMYRQYTVWCDTGVLVPGGCMPWQTPDDKGRPTFIFNIASQDEPGAYATEAWLAAGLSEAIWQSKRLGRSKLAIPRIGAGIGGLTWDQVQEICKSVASYHPTFDLIVVSLPGA